MKNVKGAMSEMPSFERAKCDNCGLCVTVCVQGGFVLIGQIVETNLDVECDNCQQCEMVCPTGAITFPFEIIEES